MMIEEEELKKQYRILLGKVQNIKSDLEELNNSLFHIINDLDENFLLEKKGLCHNELERQHTNFNQIKEELNLDIIPDIANRI